jgi:hypothetical protein
MKKTVVVFFVIGVVLFGACAQKAEAQSANIAQKIVGTWVSSTGETWVFSANGNLTQTSLSGRNWEYKYAVTDTKLAFHTSEDYGKTGGPGIYDISISSDGKTLILTRLSSGNTDGYWLTKK